MFEIKLIFCTIKLSERIMVIVYNCKERGFDSSKAYHLVMKVASKPNTCNLLTTCSSVMPAQMQKTSGHAGLIKSLPSGHHNLSLQCKESAALSEF